MKKLFLIALLGLVACSSRPKADKVAVKEPTACEKYTDQLEKAFITSSEKSANRQYSFVKDENAAQEFIDNFRFDLTDVHNQIKEMKGMLANCTEAKMLEYKSKSMVANACYPEFQEYGFLKSLAFAVKEYKWSKGTKDKSKSLIWKYIKTNSQGNSSLLQMAMTLDLYVIMTEYGFAPKKNLRELKAMSKQTADFSKELSAKYNAKNSNQYSCEALSAMKEEFDYSDKLAARVTKLSENMH